jgi:uncharacterized protein YndB with AHSA1/START domain
MSDTIEREVHIDAPVERVWELITSAEHVGRWFGDAGAEVDLRPGGVFNISWESGGAIAGTVDRVEPMSRFSYRWKQRDAGETHVEFTLAEAEGGGTRLHVRESGFASLATAPETRQALYDDHVKGWGIELGHLDDHARKTRA